MADRPTILITGAGGALGLALTRRLAAEGARIAALDRHGKASLRQALGPDDALLTGVDLESGSACAEAVAEALRRFGRLDGVAHIAGGFAAGAFGAQSASLFESMFRTNVLTAVNLFAAAAPAMRNAGRGSLVAVGASSALRASAELAAYAASKAGLLRLIESLAEEGKDHGLRANAVLPTIIDTPANRAAMPKANFAAWASPEEVAEAIAFLLSDRASGVTGAALPVPGRI